MWPEPQRKSQLFTVSNIPMCCQMIPKLWFTKQNKISFEEIWILYGTSQAMKIELFTQFHHIVSTHSIKVSESTIYSLNPSITHLNFFAQMSNNTEKHSKKIFLVARNLTEHSDLDSEPVNGCIYKYCTENFHCSFHKHVHNYLHI